jgi:hypothetical protein
VKGKVRKAVVQVDNDQLVMSLQQYNTSPAMPAGACRVPGMPLEPFPTFYQLGSRQHKFGYNKRLKIKALMVILP